MNPFDWDLHPQPPKMFPIVAIVIFLHLWSVKGKVPYHLVPLKWQLALSSHSFNALPHQPPIKELVTIMPDAFKLVTFRFTACLVPKTAITNAADLPDCSEIEWKSVQRRYK